eukprot:gene14244-18184_t
MDNSLKTKLQSLKIAMKGTDFGQEAQVSEIGQVLSVGDGIARAYGLDVTDPDQIEHTLLAVEAELGPVDVLVNNAGIGERTGFLDLSLEAWRQVMDINLTGAFLCAQAVARRMVARQSGGSIISVASVAGLTAVPN